MGGGAGWLDPHIGRSNFIRRNRLCRLPDGLQPVLGIPKEKVAGFTVVIVLIYVVLTVIISGILIGIAFSTLFGSDMMGGALSGA